MDNYDDRQIRLLAERAFRSLKDTVMFTQKRRDIRAFFHLMDEYIMITGIPCEHTINGTEHKVAIQHEMGSKWSEFIKELLVLVFEVAESRADYELTESCVIANVDLPESIYE